MVIDSRENQQAQPHLPPVHHRAYAIPISSAGWCLTEILHILAGIAASIETWVRWLLSLATGEAKISVGRCRSQSGRREILHIHVSDMYVCPGICMCVPAE